MRGVGTEPKSEAGRHGNLKVRVAGHEYVAVVVALPDEFAEKGVNQLDDLLQLVAREKFEVNQHLVVTRASRMNFLADVTESLGKYPEYRDKSIEQFLLDKDPESIAEWKSLFDIA